MGFLSLFAKELLAELPNQFPLRPGQPVVFDRHGEQTLFAPAVTFDLIGGTPFAAVALRMPPHRCTSLRHAA
jgi:hypothetical protein|tara:strand:- start:539 stop:754 length:216 start_codon:yes stop_codon:yes gene_type:complete